MLAAPWVVQETAYVALGNFWSLESLQDPLTWNKWTTKWTSMYNSMEKQLGQNPIDLSLTWVRHSEFGQMICPL